jgi:ABC-type bacteriocin/lantibiotic exporter with double-glycine peptidase domain
MKAQEPSVAPHTSSSARALHRWLTMLGAGPDVDGVLERCPERAQIAHLVQQCTEHGVPVRVVQVTGDALGSLRLPALLPLTDGTASLLTDVGPLRVRLENADGQCTSLRRAKLLAEWKGVALQELPGLGERPGVMRAWLRTLLRERRRALEAAALSMMLAALGLIAPWLAGQAIDGALVTGASRQLYLLAIGCFLATVAFGALGYLRQRVLLGLDALLQTTALREVFRRLLARPYLKVSRLSLGEQTQSMDSTQRLTQTPADFTFAPLLDLMTMFGYALALCFISWAAGACASLMTLLATSIGGLSARRAARMETERSVLSARAVGLLHALVTGVMSIKAAAATRACLRRWFSLFVEERTLGLRRERVDLAAACLTLGVHQATTLSVVAWAAHAVLEGKLSLGGLAAALMYVEGLNGAGARLTRAVQRFGQVAPHLGRVRAVLAEDPPPVSLARSAPPLRHRVRPLGPTMQDEDLAIVLDHVWFRYATGEPWILRDYSVRVRRGEFLRLSGASGRGKTTILRLIAGLVQPERGTVHVFGAPPVQAASTFAYLPQDAHLLEGSILANLTLMSGVAPEALAPALRATALDSWIDTLPMRLETLLPPGGTTLSGGQRQWIALTAAVASTRPIALLDEPTSHLDRLRREQLDLERLFAGRTVVMVSHEAVASPTAPTVLSAADVIRT